MKNPNGFGSVVKLSGKRRRPYAIRITVGFNDKGTQKYKYLSYYETQREAIIALSEFNKIPYDINANSVTFAELCSRYDSDGSQGITPALKKLNKTNFNHCQPIHKTIFKDLRRAHLQGIIDSLETVTAKANVASYLRKLYKFALDNDIVHKDYAQTLVAPSKNRKSEKTIFSDSEISTLWEIQGNINADILLVLLYSGMRISELLNLTKDKIFIDENHIITGSKTEAGRDRYIPIHSKIKPIIERHLQNETEFLFITKQGKAIRYDSFQAKRFQPLMKKLNFKHSIHETRHTFITKLHAAGADKLAVKKIVGHAAADTTEGYTHIQNEDLHAAVSLID